MEHSTHLNTLLADLLADAATRRPPPTTLTDAALRDDVAAIDEFIDGGADIDERSIGFTSPLAAAAGRGNLAAVRRLIERGASLEPPGALFPLLAFAITQRRLAVIEHVLRAGAPVAPYRSLMLEMAKRGAWDAVDALIVGGADRAWLNAEQCAALDAFVQKMAPRSPEYRERLIIEQRQFDQKSIGFTTASRLEDGVRADKEAQAVAILAQHPELAHSDSGNGTPLLALAAESGAIGVVDALLRSGATPNPVASGPSPLVRALRRADLTTVSMLLAAGADANAISAGAAHPLLEAARAGSLACVEALIASGAQAHAPIRRAIGQAVRGPHFRRIIELVQQLPPPRRKRREAVPAQTSGTL